MATQCFKRSLPLNLYREGKKILLVCFLLPLKRDENIWHLQAISSIWRSLASCLLPPHFHRLQSPGPGLQRLWKVCPFFLLENSRPLSPWGPLDFLSTCLGNDSLNWKSTLKPCGGFPLPGLVLQFQNLSQCICSALLFLVLPGSPHLSRPPFKI